MMVEMSVFSVGGSELVAFGQATINGKDCLALVDLPTFDAAMEAMVNNLQPKGTPQIRWMERRQDLLAPLDAKTEKVFSEKLAVEVGDWLRVH